MRIASSFFVSRFLSSSTVTRPALLGYRKVFANFLSPKGPSHSPSSSGTLVDQLCGASGSCFPLRELCSFFSLPVYLLFPLLLNPMFLRLERDAVLLETLDLVFVSSRRSHAPPLRKVRSSLKDGDSRESLLLTGFISHPPSGVSPRWQYLP